MCKFFKTIAHVGPDAYNYVTSTTQITPKRRKEIEERRGFLKVEATDSEIVKIVIEEILAYKPTMLTLDDRYVQLEQILDAINTTRMTGATNDLIALCRNIAYQMSENPGVKNALLERLASVNRRILEQQSISCPRAKL